MRLRAVVTALAGAGLAVAAVVAVPSAASAVPAFPGGSAGALAVKCSAPGVPQPCFHTGAAVKAVQSALKSRGYVLRGYTYGVYDGPTAAAVKRFKSARPNLGSSNMVGPLTYAAITGHRPSSGGSSGGGSVGGSSGTVHRIPSNYESESVCPSGSDPTTTSAARQSRSVRAQVSLAAFVSSPMGCRVIVRESNGDCRNQSNGTYFGKWQLDMQEWPYYGGTRYASTPYRATCAQQDVIAYRNWVDRYWVPWSTACYARDNCPAGRLN